MTALALVLGALVLVLLVLAAAVVDHYRDKSRQLDTDINRILRHDHDQEES